MNPVKKAVIVVAALAALGAIIFGVALYKVSDPISEMKVPANVPPTWAKVRTSAGHTKHLTTKKKPVVCGDCHNEADGKFAVLPETACAKCHEPQAKLTHVGKKGDDHTGCTSCHAFGEKPAPTCISCHAERQNERAAIGVHASKDAPCKSCHMPHRDPQVKQTDCVKCHAKIDANHGKQHVASDVSAVRGWLDAGADKNLVATAAASAPACNDCHAPHTKAAAATTTCTSCHTNAPKGAHPSNHAACSTCHAGHDFERAAVKPCASCHENKRGASANPNHATCGTCHVAHDAPGRKAVCVNCHSKQHTLAEAKVAKHADCTSCHSPHDPKASPAAACATCHGNISAKHAPGKSDRCVDCHAPHPRGATANHPASTLGAPGNPARALACSTCHKPASSDKAFHAKGVSCTNCHEPHTFSMAKPNAAFCQKCHAQQQTQVSTNKGHTDCMQCHAGPHAPKEQKATCATCHKVEASMANDGHKDCMMCHEQHSGRVLPAATACKSCHTKEGASAHARVNGANSANVNGSCLTCHRQHGPNGVASPPACVTCHTAGSLPSLHRVGGRGRDGGMSVGPPGNVGHASCPTCHSSHDPAKAARADRATCTSCHTDRKDHQPEAKVCSGCHVFRK